MMELLIGFAGLLYFIYRAVKPGKMLTPGFVVIMLACSPFITLVVMSLAIEAKNATKSDEQRIVEQVKAQYEEQDKQKRLEIVRCLAERKYGPKQVEMSEDDKKFFSQFKTVGKVENPCDKYDDNGNIRADYWDRYLVK